MFSKTLITKKLFSVGHEEFANPFSPRKYVPTSKFIFRPPPGRPSWRNMLASFPYGCVVDRKKCFSSADDTATETESAEGKVVEGETIRNVTVNIDAKSRVPEDIVT